MSDTLATLIAKLGDCPRTQEYIRVCDLRSSVDDAYADAALLELATRLVDSERDLADALIAKLVAALEEAHAYEAVSGIIDRLVPVDEHGEKLVEAIGRAEQAEAEQSRLADLCLEYEKRAVEGVERVAVLEDEVEKWKWCFAEALHLAEHTDSHWSITDIVERYDKAERGGAS